MRLQVLDESARFSCGSCTACCDQPWRTMIEADRAHVLDRHDFGAYPQLAGKRYYRKPADGRAGYYELSKGEGTRCLFLDADGLCIIHKELGPQAKPHMCRQFPYLPARTWYDDRISVNYGCPSVQKEHGRPLAEQSDEIAELVPLTPRETRPDALVPLDARSKITKAESDVLFDRALDLFREDLVDNIWTPLAELLCLLMGVQAFCQNPCADAERGLAERLAEKEALPAHPVGQPDSDARRDASGDARLCPPEPLSLQSFSSPAAAPMPVRFLFAATLYPDTLSADASGGIGFFRRLTLMPKLFSLATLTGGYASRLLDRNVSIPDVLKHEVEPVLSPGATALLLRYCRARLMQRLIAGTRLPIVGGVHQHIHDINAVIFLARAEAAHRNQRQLDDDLIRQALTRVEFHLANQTRLFDQTLKGWLKSQLCDAQLAMQSLRLMALDRASVAAA